MATPALPLTVQHMDGGHFQTRVRAPEEEGRGWRAVLAYYLRDGWVRHPMLDALHANAGHPDLDQVRRVLARGASPNMRLILGTYPHATVLGWAVDMGDKPLIELLATHHVDLELPYGNRAETPLCAALRQSKADVAELLVKLGASWEGFGRVAEKSNQWVSAGWWAQENGLWHEPWGRPFFLKKRLETVLEPVEEAVPRKRARL